MPLDLKYLILEFADIKCHICRQKFNDDLLWFSTYHPCSLVVI